jgi:hypothetical protein
MRLIAALLLLVAEPATDTTPAGRPAATAQGRATAVVHRAARMGARSAPADARHIRRLPCPGAADCVQIIRDME